MNVFEAVKQSVTTRQAAEYYGIHVGRNGMACCPFHNDKTPSMKLDRRYHCFGCGADGDVIDFAAALYGLGKKEAAVQLAQDFGLSYEDWKPPGKVKKPKTRQKSPEEQFQEAKNRCFRILADYLHLLMAWRTDYAPHSPEEAFHPRFVKERVMEIAGRDKINHSVIIGGTKGIVLWRSELKENNDVIDLVMTYRVEPWLPVFGVGEMTLVNRCYVKTYTGYEEGDGSQNDKKYYVADTGEVYHLYRSCTHLQFSISQIEITELKNARNENGGKYKPCEICWDENTPQNRCYITTQGDRYHSSVSCTGLKRTIYIINASQIGNKPLCSRCGGQ